MKVAISHQSFSCGDAIGNDIAGMYRLLMQMGCEPFVLCEWHSRTEDFRIIDPQHADLSSFSFIIYHHSIYWEFGDYLVTTSTVPIIFKYHNITPANFFDPYSAKYAEVCRRGRQQTVSLTATKCRHTWLADSSYNRDELIEAGAKAANTHVVPPFNRTESLLTEQHAARYEASPIELLFISRFAPNKGHRHLLQIARALLSDFSSDLLLRFVGALDFELDSYQNEILTMISELSLEGKVEIRAHCSDSELLGLLRTSHIYLSCSEHEGFCVPLIEAQASGLPVIAAATGAVAETAGPDQFIPGFPVDYAALIHEICQNKSLRDQVIAAGLDNVRARFSNESIENAFVGAIYDVVRSA